MIGRCKRSVEGIRVLDAGVLPYEEVLAKGEESGESTDDLLVGMELGEVGKLVEKRFDGQM